MNKNFYVIDGIKEFVGVSEEEDKPVYATVTVSLKINEEDIKDILREIVDVYFCSVEGLNCEDVITQIVDNKKTKTMICASGQTFQLSKYAVTKAIGEAVADGYIVIDDREIDLFPSSADEQYVDELSQVIASYLIPSVRMVK